MINKITNLLDNFFENKNAGLKFSRKLANKEFTIRLGIGLIITINICIGILLEGISSLGGFLYGRMFNIFNIINPIRILQFFPLYIVLNVLTLGAYAKLIFNIRSSFKEIDEGQKGTSRFATQEEVHAQYRNVPASKEVYKGKGGVPIARNYIDGKQIIYIDDSPVNNLVIGTTRSGKGETFVVPAIDIYSRAMEKASLIVNDPKGELVAMCRETLEKRGYEVHMLNLLEPINSMSYNPLQLVKEAYKKKNYSEAQLVCNTLTHSLYTNPNTKDPFWENSAKSLVNALILAICDECIKNGEEDKITLYTVANMLSELGGSSRIDDNGNEVNLLDEYFKELPKDSVAKSQYATSSFAGGNTRGGIFSMAMSKLQNFTFEEIAKMTSKSSLDFEDIGFNKTSNSKPKAIFMVTPDYDSSNHVLVSIFIRQTYYVLAKQASLSDTGKCDIEVIYLLDEGGNLPPIEGMANIFTVCLGRGIRFNLIVQGLSQLEKLYGEDAKTIIGNCGNKIYILSNDNETAENFSKSLGQQTIVTNSRSGEVFSLNKSHTESLDSRELIKADELKIKEGESLVVRVIKRRDNAGNKITPHPIFNRDDYAMRYRYEYLSDDFDNVKNVFKDVKVISLHKDVKLKDLIIDFERITNDRIENFLNRKLNNNNELNELGELDETNILEEGFVDQEVLAEEDGNILTDSDKKILFSVAKSKLSDNQKKIIKESIHTSNQLEEYLKAINYEDLYKAFMDVG